MKRLHILFGSLLILTISSLGLAHAEDAASAMKRIAGEVAVLNLGFDDYVLGRTLNKEQQAMAKANRIAKSVEGTIKFQDGDVFVIARNDDYLVLGIYKEYTGAERQEVKNVVGDLMLRFNEPTTMAHDKLIYWAFNKDGRIDQDDYKSSKQSEDTNIIATVKFHSTSSIFPDPAPKQEKQGNKEAEEKADIYVMITSDPLSKIFLAQQ